MLDDVFPDGIPISLRGSTKSPKLDVSRMIARYKTPPKLGHSKDAGKQLNDLLDQLAVPAKHKSHGNPTTSTQPSAN
jgi:hypothetical protein